MIAFKACPRCKGDMKLDRDIYGSYKECLQCGYMEDTPKAQSTPDREEHRVSVAVKRAA